MLVVTAAAAFLTRCGARDRKPFNATYVHRNAKTLHSSSGLHCTIWGKLLAAVITRQHVGKWSQNLGLSVMAPTLDRAVRSLLHIAARLTRDAARW
jgi:hypothetical protein